MALTAERRHELRLLSLLGATRRELWRMLATETLMVGLIGLILGTLVGGATLVTFSQGVTGSPLPSVPMLPYLVIVAAVAVLAAPCILITGHRTLRALETPGAPDAPARSDRAPVPAATW